ITAQAVVLVLHALVILLRTSISHGPPLPRRAMVPEAQHWQAYSPYPKLTGCEIKIQLNQNAARVSPCLVVFLENCSQFGQAFVASFFVTWLHPGKKDSIPLD